MKVAIVHDWLTGMRGGERVLEALLELHPEAEIFTLFHDRGSVSDLIEDRPIHTSALDPARMKYRYLLPLFPWAVERFDLTGFDLVLSSSHCVAKGARAPREAPHICYCHTPMRYVWDQYEAYFGKGRSSWPVRATMAGLRGRLQRWDARTATYVDHFVANSSHVRARIRTCYGRDATVVHPPVDLDRFEPREAPRGDYYLMLGALVPYKRADLAVEAFSRSGKRLKIVGGGVEQDRLRAMAGPNVEVTGPVSDAAVARHLAECRAVLLPGVEDFGIGVVEALASGTPVIALRDGGALDTIRESGNGSGPANGVFFERPTVPALVDAVERFERLHFDPAAVAATAAPYARERFRDRMRAEIDRVLDGWPRRPDGSAAGAER